MTFADPFAEFNAALGRYSPAFRSGRLPRCRWRVAPLGDGVP
jgi:hypothetical protein